MTIIMLEGKLHWAILCQPCRSFASLPYLPSKQRIRLYPSRQKGLSPSQTGETLNLGNRCWKVWGSIDRPKQFPDSQTTRPSKYRSCVLKPGRMPTNNNALTRRHSFMFYAVITIMISHLTPQTILVSHRVNYISRPSCTMACSGNVSVATALQRVGNSCNRISNTHRWHRIRFLRKCSRRQCFRAIASWVRHKKDHQSQEQLQYVHVRRYHILGRCLDCRSSNIT